MPRMTVNQLLKLLLYFWCWRLCSSLSIFSWNTLSVGDTFADGWGAAGEIIRMENLATSENISIEQAEALLLSERYQRVTVVLNRARSMHEVIAIQEADLETVEGGEYLLKYFTPEVGSWRSACVASNNDEQILLLIDTHFVNAIHSKNINDNGVLGCSTFVKLHTGEYVTLLNIHLSASMIRDPTTRDKTLETLISFMPTDGRVVTCGDFNSHLPDLLEDVIAIDSEHHHWSIYTASNSSMTSSRSFFFTTQHEHNYMGAYDGYLTRDVVGGGIITVEVHENGFMPKYLGVDKDTYGMSSFRYSDGPYPDIEGELLFYGSRLDTDSSNQANASLSDHLAVSLTIDRP